MMLGFVLSVTLLVFNANTFSFDSERNLFKLGVIAEEKEQFSSAITFYGEIKENSQLYPYAVIRKARCLVKIGEISSAITLLKSLYESRLDKDVPWKLPLVYNLFSICSSQNDFYYLNEVRSAIDTLPFLSWWITPYLYDVGYFLFSRSDYHKGGSEVLNKVLDYRGYNPVKKKTLMALALSNYEEDKLRVLDVLIKSGGLSEAWLIMQNVYEKEWLLYVGVPNEVKNWELVRNFPGFLQFLIVKDSSKKTTIFLEYVLRALILGGQIDIFESLFDQFKSFFSSDEEKGDLFYWSAQNLNKQDFGNKVETYFMRFIEEFPAHKKVPDAYFALANWYLKVEKKEEAYKCLKIIQERYPSSLYYSQASYLCGKICEDREDNKGAIENYKHALKGKLGDYYLHKSAERLYRKFHITSFEKYRIVPLGNIPVCAVRVGNLVNPKKLVKENISDSNEVFELLSFFSEIGVEEKEWITFWLIDKFSQGLKNSKMLILYANYGSPQVVLDYYYSLFSIHTNNIDEKDERLIMFPIPYFDVLTTVAKDYELDPFLVWSIMRQESTYRTDVISSSDARGLLQVVPSTAKWVVDKKMCKGEKDHQLWRVPEHNIEIGVAYFKYLLEKYNGNTVYALSAYNGGPKRVDGWVSGKKFRNIDEYIESIPIFETKNYVKKVLGNYSAYHSIYESIK